MNGSHRHSHACALVVVLIAVLLLSAGAGSSVPRAQRGIIDLSSWDFSQGIAKLDGEWEFYWSTWLDPESFTSGAVVDEPYYVLVPGSWSESVKGNLELPSDGYGTYRLKVLLGEERDPLALHLRDIRSAYTLWVNGEKIVEHGAARSDGKSERPAGGAVTVGIGPGDTELEIILQISNHSFRSGGIANSVLLGDAQDVLSYVKRSLSIATFLISALLFSGFVHLGIWIVRRAYVQRLYLGLFCIMFAVRTAMMDQAPITLFLPQIGWELMLKFEYLGLYLGAPLLGLFMHAMYPREVSSKVAWSFAAAGAAFGLVTLMTPGRFNSQLLIYFEVVTFVALVYFNQALIRSARRGRDGAILILIAWITLFLVFIHDALYFWRILGSGQLAPVALLGLVLAYSIVLAQQLIDGLEYEARLTRENVELLETVKRQVEQIKASRRLAQEREERTRRTLAEALHGTVQARLLSARYFLDKAARLLRKVPDAGAEMDEVCACLDKALDQLDHSREDVREISHLLHPTVIGAGLVPAVRSLTNHFADQLKIDLRTTGQLATDLGDESEMDPNVSLVAYRVLEEALNNVVKHAAATEVHITLDLRDGLLTLEVQDNGKGMHPEALQHGLGLEMVESRVEELNGSYEIETSPGAGMVLRVRLPADRK